MGDDWSELCSKPKLNLVTELLSQSKSSSSTSDSGNDNDSTTEKPQTKNLSETSNENDKTVDKTESKTIPGETEKLSQSATSSIAVDSDAPSAITIATLPSNDDEDTPLDDEEIAKTEMDSNQEAASSNYSRKSTPVESLADLLPSNSFFYNRRNSYIFPGAEIYLNDSDDESSSSSTESDYSSSSSRKQYELNATVLCNGSASSRRRLPPCEEDDSNSLDLVSTSGSKSNHLPEAKHVKPETDKDEVSTNKRSHDDVSTTTSTSSVSETPRTKRPSTETVEAIEPKATDGYAVAQKRCKYSSE